jgi:hypothetical protein
MKPKSFLDGSVARRLSRRRALGRLGAGSLLALGLWPGSLSLQAKTGEPGAFRFLVANDLHCMSPQCGAWLEQVVDRMKTENADFCLLCGDLTEYGESEPLSMVRDAFRRLGTPVYAVPGNHDWIAPASRRPYQSLFHGQLNYCFEHRGWQFIGLDSTEGQRYELTSIQPATFHWLDRQLPRLDPRQPTVVFTHFPLGEAVHYRPRNAEAVLDRFQSFNLTGVFSGHWHGYTLRKQGPAYALTGNCCALRRDNHDRSPAKGYLVADACEGILTWRFAQCPVPQALAEEARRHPVQRPRRSGRS